MSDLIERLKKRVEFDEDGGWIRPQDPILPALIELVREVERLKNTHTTDDAMATLSYCVEPALSRLNKLLSENCIRGA